MSRKSIALIAIAALVIGCKKPGPGQAPTTTPARAATATMATTATLPLESPYKLDHFKFWQVAPGQFSEKMELFGQCDNAPWRSEIGPAEYLGNPSDKRHGNNHVTIGNAKLHYLAYAIGQHEPQPPRHVVFSNQFTNATVTWELDDPKYLLVPVGKVTEGEPTRQQGDHFVCYAVSGKPFDTNISL
jgi:hypothetical protein